MYLTIKQTKDLQSESNEDTFVVGIVCINIAKVPLIYMFMLWMNVSKFGLQDGDLGEINV